MLSGKFSPSLLIGVAGALLALLALQWASSSCLLEQILSAIAPSLDSASPF